MTKIAPQYTEIPNLDAMPSSDLRAFWKRYARPSRLDAQLLIGDRLPGFTLVARKLAAYACNKAVAMECRERGDIRGATCYESICDRIYSELPEDLRW